MAHLHSHTTNEFRRANIRAEVENGRSSDEFSVVAGFGQRHLRKLKRMVAAGMIQSKAASHDPVFSSITVTT